MGKRIIVFDGYARNPALLRRPLLSTLADLGHEVIVYVPSAPPWVRATLSEIGVVLHDINIQRHSVSPIEDLKLCFKLRKVLQEVQPDLLLNYTIKPVIWGSIAARSLGVDVCSFITGLGHSFLDDRLRGRALNRMVSLLYRASLAKNRVVFFQNHDDLSEFRKRGLLKQSTEAVVLNGSGVDVEFFDYSPVPQSPRFIFTGRLLAEKGLREYVAAARKVKAAYPAAIFQILGPMDGNPSGLGPDEIQGWSTEGVVEFLGETSDVREYLRRAAIFVLPSYREGTPRSTLEALSMGRPVITCDVPGCKSTVVQGENGYLVPPRDPAALASAMERFAADPSLIAPMAIRSRQLALDMFDARKVNQVILEHLGLDSKE